MSYRYRPQSPGFILKAPQSKLLSAMGYQDRDWYKEARSGAPPVVRGPSAPQRKTPWFSYALLWVVIGVALYGLVTTFIPGMQTHRVHILQGGSAVFRTNRAGNYIADGSINGVPVQFIVDTGASLTSVSRRLARHMGLSGCEPARSTTANGVVEGCIALARDVQFGGFLVQNVPVAIMPRMARQALLGMNVLSLFHITQDGGRMVIYKKCTVKPTFYRTCDLLLPRDRRIARCHLERP